MEEKRDTWLDQDVLNRLWGVLDRYPNHITAYVFKLLILTGARKEEILRATWDQFDLAKEHRQSLPLLQNRKRRSIFLYLKKLSKFLPTLRS